MFEVVDTPSAEKRAREICKARIEQKNHLGHVVAWRRPRLHPWVPHPGTGEGAVRMMTRLIEKGMF